MDATWYTITKECKTETSLYKKPAARTFMDVLQQYNMTRFMGFIPTIRKSIKEWRIIEASLTGKTHHNIAFIAKKLQVFFEGREGIIFICNSKELLALVRTGESANTDNLLKGMNDNMPEHSCSAVAGNVTADGLLTIQIKLQDRPEADNKALSHLLTVRQQREENIIMVVDDDNFMRSLISKALNSKARVIEPSDDSDIVEAYLEHLPDIVFLDIHLPRISGIRLLEEIQSFDDSAHIIIISSDSNKDNVLEAKKLGAKGFLAKPFVLEKIESCYDRCPTIRKRA